MMLDFDEYRKDYGLLCFGIFFVLPLFLFGYLLLLVKFSFDCLSSSSLLSLCLSFYHA